MESALQKERGRKAVKIGVVVLCAVLVALILIAREQDRAARDAAAKRAGEAIVGQLEVYKQETGEWPSELSRIDDWHALHGGLEWYYRSAGGEIELMTDVSPLGGPRRRLAYYSKSGRWQYDE